MLKWELYANIFKQYHVMLYLSNASLFKNTPLMNLVSSSCLLISMLLQIFNNTLMADRAVPSYLYCRLLSYKSETNFTILLMLGWIGLIIASQDLNHFVRYVVYCFFCWDSPGFKNEISGCFWYPSFLERFPDMGKRARYNFHRGCLAVIVFPLLWKFVIAPGGWATSSVLAKCGWLTPLLSRLPPASVMSLVSNWKVETWKNNHHCTRS